jgi:hypothetical protein
LRAAGEAIQGDPEGSRAADTKKAITEGVRPDGVCLKPPMAYGYYKNIAPDDLDAIVAYLRTLKPL